MDNQVKFYMTYFSFFDMLSKVSRTGLRVFAVLMRSYRPQGVFAVKKDDKAAIAAELGLHPRTVMNLLLELKRVSILVSAGRGKYRLNPAHIFFGA